MPAHCSIVPPYILRAIAERGDPGDRALALASLALTLRPRRERAAPLLVAGAIKVPKSGKRRAVFDAEHSERLPGKRVRSEGSVKGKDVSANEAYDAAGTTWDFFHDVFGRQSIDDRGLRIDSSVHYGVRYANAHWNGKQMVYGDGDGKYFRRFTSSLEVVAHELAHGVSQYAAGFGFTGQPGALAEHFSDVFGVLVQQYAKKQTAARADWLVGNELFTRRVEGEAIRSMKTPGSAYDDPVLGRDPQPMHMRDFVKTRDDDGGVHINSGIPNHAFYRVATLLGGRAWEVAGKIWYRALTRELGPRSRFQQCADATWRAARDLHGEGSEPCAAVRDGWAAVGITVAQPAPRRRAPAEEWLAPAAGAELPQLA